MTALSTAEAALRRAPDDPAVPVTVSGAEAAALVAELDRLRERGDALAKSSRTFLDWVGRDGVSITARGTWWHLDRAVQQWEAHSA